MVQSCDYGSEVRDPPRSVRIQERMPPTTTHAAAAAPERSTSPLPQRSSPNRVIADHDRYAAPAMNPSIATRRAIEEGDFEVVSENTGIPTNPPTATPRSPNAVSHRLLGRSKTNASRIPSGLMTSPRTIKVLRRLDLSKCMGPLHQGKGPGGSSRLPATHPAYAPGMPPPAGKATSPARNPSAAPSRHWAAA